MQDEIKKLKEKIDKLEEKILILDEAEIATHNMLMFCRDMEIATFLIRTRFPEICGDESRLTIVD
jgi:hypothetical protein